MLLCDIGNSSYHFLRNEIDFKEDVKLFNPSTLQEKVYYICVNQDVHKILKELKNWIDLSSFVDMSSYYPTMGIDRIMASKAVKNAIVIDAGSAITVDIVKNSSFEGGFIYPGIRAMSQTYSNISPALNFSFNFECDLDIMPKNSQDAISYGYFKTLYAEVISHKMDIVLTGGDAKEFAKIFKEAKLDESLIFKGMKKIMKKANIC